MNMPLQINQEFDPGSLRRRTADVLGAGLSPQRLAVETGVKRAELLAWMDDRSHDQGIQDRIAEWFRQGDEDALKQVEPGWVETPTSMAIMDALQYAQITPTISLIYGGAGVSKTTTAMRYFQGTHNTKQTKYSILEKRRNVFYVSAAKWVRTPVAILQAITEAVNAYGAQAYRNDQLAKAILRSLNPGDLLIVDEAQHLEADALDGIRYFHDEGGIGIAYLGNEDVYTRINGRSRKATFAQLSSRVGMNLHIELPTAGDVDAILEAWGIAGRQARELAHSVALRPGGLRGLIQVLRQSRVLAAGMRKPVDAGIMKAAAMRLNPNFVG